MEHDHDLGCLPVYHGGESNGADPRPNPRMFAISSLDSCEIIACGLTYAGTTMVSRCDPDIGLDTPRAFPSPEHARALLGQRFGELAIIWL